MSLGVSYSLLGTKIDPGMQVRGYSQHITNNHVSGDRSFDNFGREGLSQHSLYSLYPGKADCAFHGLLTNETNMRPAYWRYIGDCNGNDLGYVGGQDQMILGYGSGPRGMRVNNVEDNLFATPCSSLKCGAAKNACEMEKLSSLGKKFNFGASRRTLAQEPNY